MHYVKSLPSPLSKGLQYPLSLARSLILTAIVPPIYQLIYCRHSGIILVPIRMNVKIKKVLSIPIGYKRVGKQLLTQSVGEGVVLYYESTELLSICKSSSGTSKKR